MEVFLRYVPLGYGKNVAIAVVTYLEEDLERRRSLSRAGIVEIWSRIHRTKLAALTSHEDERVHDGVSKALEGLEHTRFAAAVGTVNGSNRKHLVGSIDRNETVRMLAQRYSSHIERRLVAVALKILERELHQHGNNPLYNWK